MILTPDRGEIQLFVECLFRHAEQNTLISMRAFRDDADGTWRARDWPIVAVNGSLDHIIEAAETFASECATATVAVVFAPPVATFRQGNKATEAALANGLAISLELDICPAAARRSLEAVLGPATVVVASGGTWVDPTTGEVQHKLHCHWRLEEPTRTAIEHDFLKECRRLATRLVGGDTSSIPAIHPMRWPGSWHRKGSPRLAHIVECNPEVEITLATALNKLRAAVEKRPSANGANQSRSSTAPAEESTEQTAALIATVLRGENYHDPIAKLSMRYLMAGMADPYAVETLRGIMLAVDPGRRDYKNGLLHKDRWLSRYNDITRAVSTARSKIAEPAPSSDKAGDEPWPAPASLLKDEIETAPQFPVSFLPGPLADFACDVTDRMQCAVDIVAVPLIISAATTIGKGFCMAPKAGDDWTERPCLWGGLILPIGSMKSPGFAKALQPLRRLQAQFHAQHEIELEEYEAKCTRADYAAKTWKAACSKAAKDGKEMPEKPEAAVVPEPPKLRRLVTGDITQEALADLIEQNPRGLLLFRDELSGWFASFNQYRAGADRQFYLECHAGGSFAKDRRVGSVLIDDLYLNICGGIQPQIVREVLSGGDLDGMTARFSLLVWPDRTEEFFYVDRQPNHNAEHATDKVFKKLLSFEPAAFFGPYKPGTTRAFRFDDTGQELFIDWYIRNQKHVRKDKEPASLTAHFSKYAGLFPRLAIIHHLIRHALNEVASPLLVDAETAAAVEGFIDEYLEPHARRIHRHLGADPLRDNARRIATWIVENPTMTTFKARDIRRKEWSGLTAQDDVNKALDYLENVAGWVRCATDLPGPKGGRPSSTYRINPMVQR
jgi:putative DNA primase/helicase